MRALLITASLLLASCGYVGRAVVDHVVAIQSRAAVPSPRQACSELRKARMKTAALVRCQSRRLRTAKRRVAMVWTLLSSRPADAAPCRS